MKRMRVFSACLIVIAMTGNVITSTAATQGVNTTVRLNLPGGGAETICLASALSVSMAGTELLLNADALQNNLGCPAGATLDQAGATLAPLATPDHDHGQTDAQLADSAAIDLRGSTASMAILRLALPGGGSTDKCVALGSTAANAFDQDTFMQLQALQPDGNCPPPAIVTLNDFQLIPAALDITPGSNNCTIGGQPRRCLTVSWNTSVPPNVLTPLCTVSQTAPSGQSSMSPANFDNPGSFVNPGNPGQFVSVINNLEWPVNEGTLSAGNKSFRMQCEPGGQSITRTVAFADNRVIINSFSINQSSAAQGAQITYNWNLSVLGNPVNPSCTLRSLTSGVINPINIDPTANPVGTAMTNIRVDAPLGAQTMRLECSPIATQADDSITVTEPAAVQLQSFNIVETSVAPGGSINFNWTLSLNGNPQNPSCTLTAVNSGVISQPVTINNPGTSGASTVAILSSAPQGAQSFNFTCLPGGSSLSDSLNVSTPRVIPVSFSPQLTVQPGQMLAFDWSVFLASNPDSPNCTISSTAGGFLATNPVQLALPSSPSSQNGSGTVQVLSDASEGPKLLRFSCAPGNEPSIDVNVDVVAPPPAQMIINSFDVTEDTAPQGGLINYNFSVTLVNNPVGPFCRLDSTNGGINPVIIPLPVTPDTQVIADNTSIRSDAILNQDAELRLRCFPDFPNPNDPSNVMLDTVTVVSPDTPNVSIQTFDIVESSINPDDSFTVNWAVVVSGNPASPSCMLSSNTAGVIADQTINLTSTPANQNGSLIVTLLQDAPTGVQLFELACSPGTSVRSDNLQIVPPGANPRIQINDFQLTQSSAERGENIGFSWNVTLIDNPVNPVCVLQSNTVINQVSVPLASSPATQSGNGTAVILNSAPTGNQSFTLTCNPGGAQRFDTALITAPATPEMFIDDFQIVQSTASPDDFIDYSWAITLVNSPSGVDCRLSSAGTINQVIIPVSAASTQSGNGSVQILGSATAGNKNVNFTCTATDAAQVSSVQSVNITTAGNNPNVGIIDFDVIETAATQGGSFNFSWSVLLTDISGPGIASCTLSNSAILTAPVVLALDPANGQTQSGTSQASLRSDAATGAQSLNFSCSPGSSVRTDSINVQQAGGTPEVIINSFNIAETEAARGGQINFDWSITLVDAPQMVSCTLASDSAGVITDFTLNLPSSPSLQSGSNSININSSASTGSQGFTFSCSPGNDVLADSVNITTVPTARIDINQFNIIETGAAQGGTINFDWSVTLLNNPSSPQCVLSSDTNGVINDVVINLDASPANQSGSGNVSINGSAETGSQSFRFECNPDGQFRTDNVNVTAPGTLNLLFFDVRNVSAARLSDVIFDFTVQRVNNPVNPECTLTAPGVIDPVTVPVPTGGVTVQPIENQLATILLSAPLGVADFTLTCMPGSQTAVEQVTITDVPPPDISINSFNIVQQTANPGDTLQFDYSVSRIGMPSAPECVLLAVPNVSNEKVIPITTSGSATVTGSDDLFILSGAPAGSRQFTFACRVDPGASFSDAFGDTVTIQ